MNAPTTSFLSVMQWNWPDRLRAAGVHLILSLVLAIIVGALVFGVWFPWPYRELAGGRELFFLVITVDVVMGPLLTLAIFDRSKGWPHLRRDLALIGLMQLAALIYGVYVVAQARPVYLVYEIDRFRAVTMADIDPKMLTEATPELQSLPLTGPKVIAAVKPAEQAAFMRSFDLGMSGIDLGLQPATWRPYDTYRQSALKKAQPLAQLLERFKEKPEGRTLQEAAAAANVPVAELRALPLVSRKEFWTVLLDSKGTPVSYARVDSF